MEEQHHITGEPADRRQRAVAALRNSRGRSRRAPRRPGKACILTALSGTLAKQVAPPVAVEEAVLCIVV
jgi:hypothetical protein